MEVNKHDFGGIYCDQVYQAMKQFTPEVQHKNLAQDLANLFWEYDMLSPGKDKKDLDSEIWCLVFPKEFHDE